MYKQLTVATTIMFLMLGVLWAGAAQDAKPTDAEKEAYYQALDAEKEAYYEAKAAEKQANYDDLNAKIDAEKEAYYEALEAEKEAYYNTHKLNTKSQPINHFEILKDNDIDPAYRVQRPEVVRNLEGKYGVDVIGSNPENYQQTEKREPGPSVAVPEERLNALKSDKTFDSNDVDVLGTSLQERNAPEYNNVRTINRDLGDVFLDQPTYHFEARDDADPAQKVRLPEDVTPPAGSRDCYNWNDAWAYLWWGSNTLGQASLFSLDAGTYSLESVTIADYSGAYLGLTEATATVNVDVANSDGSTASTIATGSLVTDGNTGTLDFTGTSFELTATTFIKVSVYPSTNLGDMSGDGVDDFAPLLLSEDGTAGDGFCGMDSAGVYQAGPYDWDIAFCASPGTFTGTWQMAPEAGALMVGPAPNDGSWWSNSADDVVLRACYFDDDYVFNADGSFNNVLGDDTWIEGWQGGSDACGAPVYPHDGSNAATWVYDAGAGTITLNGVGAYLGLPKAHNEGELGSPDDAPESITYDITLSDNDNTMTLVIEAGAGVFWTFKLIEVIPNDDCANAEYVSGPYPVEITSSSEGAAVDCEGFLNWDAVWYELELPYASNNVDVFVQADGAISNGGIILMDDCACDDYIGSSGFDWDPAGGWLNVWFDGVVDSGGTILFPLYVAEPQGFTVTFDVTDADAAPSIDIQISVTVDSWASEASWNLWNYDDGTYYYADNQTFSTGGENQTVVLSLTEGSLFSVDCWDSYGDGGIAGEVTDAATGGALVDWASTDYTDYGYFDFTAETGEVPSDPPANDECANAEAVTGPYPVEITSTSADATVDCEGFLNWNAVWYELELPYFSNNVDVNIQADGAISNGGIVLMDDCACDDYIASSGYAFDPAGGNLNVWFDEVSGPDNGGTILFPLFIVDQQGFTVTFNVTSPPNPAVFFSEYAEGSSNHKYLEIYNGTGAAVSLNDYVILGNYNGNPYSETFTFATDATLASGDVYVLANDAADSSILAHADEVFAYGDPWYITSFNGDDVRALSHLAGSGDTVIIDIIGTLEGGDPGSGWAVAGIDNATKDHTLVRKGSVTIGNDGDWAMSAGTDADDSEWIVFDQNDWSYVGSHPHCFEPNVLIVNMYDSYGDGWNGNVLTIGDQTFELLSGDFATGEACMPYGDFAVTCDGGSWQEEVSWEIMDEAGNLLLAGGAPYSGTLPLDAPYTLTLSTASWASEISWAITAAGDSGNVIYTGSGYSNSTDYEFGFDLADGDYEFHMYDSYGDGWNGATYSIDDAAGHNISSGGLASGDYGMDPFTLPWTAPLYPYYFTLNTASWASEISWAVTAAGDSGNAIYTGSGYSNSSTYADTFDLADGDYEFHLYDSYGDGWNGATYVILDDDGNTVSAGGLASGDYGMDPFSVPFVFAYNLTLTTASWASEISWAITAAGDSNAVYSGSGYSNSTEYVIGLDLADGDYEFHLYDSYGDGWNGATYSIDDAAGHNISSGGLTDGDYGMDPFTLPWTPPNPPYYFTLTTASWASEISWTLTAAGDSTALYSGSGYANDSTYVDTFGLADGDYDLNMYDSYGDGWNGASFTIVDEEANMIASGGLASGSEGTISFSVPYDPAYILTLTTASWGGEVGWFITAAMDTTGLLDGYGYASNTEYVIPFDLPDGMYVFHMYDTFGDSWNGATFSITDTEGNVIAEGGLESYYYHGDVGLTLPYGGPVTAIFDIQYVEDPDSSDASPLDGQEVTVEGVVLGTTSSGYYLQTSDVWTDNDFPCEAWEGIYVYDGNGPSVGHAIRITGTVTEYYNLTEIIDVSAFGIYSTDWDVPTPVSLATGDVSSEAYEGVLVSTAGVCDNADLGNGEWSIDDGSGSAVIDDQMFEYMATEGNSYTVMGPLNFSYSAFKIEPRSADDIVDLGSPDLCPPSDLMANAGDGEVYLDWTGYNALGVMPPIDRVGLDLPAAQKARLPKGVTRSVNSRECYNLNESWYYFWYGHSEFAQASIFSFEAGSYSLESVAIADYSNAGIGLTEATATVNVGITDWAGTVETIATGTLVTDGSSGLLDFTGTSFVLDTASWVIVSVLPTTNVGDLSGDGVDDFAPFLLSEDGTDPSGWCGWDSSGWTYWDVYDWDIELCASGGGGNECGTFSNYNVYMGDELVGQTDIEEFVVDGLENDMEYCFNVTAVYAEGESEASNEACATPMAPSMWVSTDAMADTLMPGESVDHSFTIENTGGMPFSYDVMIGSGAPAFSEDFEGGDLGEMSDAMGAWQVADAATASSQYLTYPEGSLFAFINDDAAGADGPPVDATLTSPVVSIDGSEATLVFDMFYPQTGGDCASGGAYSDNASVSVSIDGGDFQIVADAALVYPEWMTHEISLGPVSTVQIAVNYSDCSGNWGYGVGVDDIGLMVESEGPTWLTLSSDYGELEPGEADEIVVTMNAGELEEGTYDAEIGVYTFFGEHMIAMQMVIDDGVGVTDGGAIPDVFALHQNFPNPFNPLTAISYDVPEFADVKIDIYNLLGQNVRTLVTGEHEPGFYRAIWNGKNDQGALVTTGVYIYLITARSNATGEVAFTKTRKLVLMK